MIISQEWKDTIFYSYQISFVLYIIYIYGYMIYFMDLSIIPEKFMKVKNILTLKDYIIIIIIGFALIYLLMMIFPILCNIFGCVETMENVNNKQLPKRLPQSMAILIMILICYGAMNTTVNNSQQSTNKKDHRCSPRIGGERAFAKAFQSAAPLYEALLTGLFGPFKGF